MAYTAIHRHARISARKVRPLADLIRGKARRRCAGDPAYQPQRGARMLEKLIKSALGNAEDLRAPNVGGLGGEGRPGRWRSDVQADAAREPAAWRTSSRAISQHISVDSGIARVAKRADS